MIDAAAPAMPALPPRRRRAARQFDMTRAFGSGEALFALSIAGLGLLVVIVGSGYSMGAANDPGPGIFPVVLGAALIVIGGGIYLSTDRRKRPGERLRIRPFITVVAAVLAWALLVDPLGFIPATLVLVVLSGFAETRFRPVQTAVLALVLSLAGYAVFVYGFRMPFDAFGW